MISFRNWTHNLYLENCEERQIYCDSSRLSEQEYFQKFKWWLRKEYKHRRQIEREKNETRQRYNQWN